MSDNIPEYAMFCGTQWSKIWESEVQRANQIYCVGRCVRCKHLENWHLFLFTYKYVLIRKTFFPVRPIPMVNFQIFTKIKFL